MMKKAQRPATQSNEGDQLRTLLHTLTTLVLATGCVPEEATKWDPIMCEQGGPALTELQATRALDYLSINTETSTRFGGVGTDTRMSYTATLLSYGDPCSGSAQPAECEKQFVAARSVTDCDQPVCDTFAVAGLAGAFERIESREALRALLGDIDTLDEALALAAFDGQQLSCPQFDQTGTQWRETARGYELETEYDSCNDGIYRDFVRVQTNGELTRVEHENIGKSQCVVGRRPAGLVAAANSRAASEVGAFLAQSARLEAASVYAFRMLADVLQALGAPEALVARARESSADEVRHAREVGRLARRFGASLCAPELLPVPAQDALAVAIENAVEGCVRETFGALVATYQARTARDPEVRRVMQQIAEDETRHAQLSWELASWLDTRLSDDERARVARERGEATAKLWHELDTGLDGDACAILGYPSASVSAALLRGLSHQLWS